MESTIEAHQFADDGETPNNPKLPLVIIHRTGAIDHNDPAAWFEEQFTAHGWGACWRWVVYDYHHFHSDNHEVLGVSRGRATLLLGGKDGREFQVEPGDVIILPAGTGHRSLDASDDFQVVGAYPEGKEPDLIRPGETDLASVRTRISQVPLPDQDPIFGQDGGINRHWRLHP